MKQLAFQTESRYRRAFAATFVGGMAVCSLGISHTTTSGWLHPASVSGIVLGLLAFALGGSVLFRRSIGPIKGDRTALFTLFGIIVLKFLVSILYAI